MKQRGRKSGQSRATLSVVGGFPRVVASTSYNPPPCPEHLAPPERAIWDQVVRSFKGEDAAFAVLASGLESHMRARECREIIEREGLITLGRDDQTKAHPLCNVERDARKAFQATFKALGIKL